MAVDVAVIGGGVHGCAVAYELTRRGLEVMVLERRELASGASGGPGKRGVRANNRDPRELPLAREAQTMWPHLSETLGADTGYEQIGGMQLVEVVGDVDRWLLERMESVARVQNAHGIATEVVGRQRLDELQPGFAEAVVGATWCPADGMADQNLVTVAYAGAAERGGAEIRLGAMATAITAGDPAVIQLDGGGSVRARRVVIAANSFSGPLVSHSFGVNLPVWATALQVVLASAPDGFAPRRLVGHLSRTLSLKPLTGGITMISGGYHGRWDPVTEVGTPIDERVRANLDVAAAVLPGLSGVEVHTAVTDRVEGFSHDGVPIIDEVPGAEGVFVATGWSGHGFAIAPAVAPHLADWVVTRARPEVLAPFSLARFSLAWR